MNQAEAKLDSRDESLAEVEGQTHPKKGDAAGVSEGGSGKLEDLAKAKGESRDESLAEVEGQTQPEEGGTGKLADLSEAKDKVRDETLAKEAELERLANPLKTAVEDAQIKAKEAELERLANPLKTAVEDAKTKKADEAAKVEAEAASLPKNNKDKLIYLMENCVQDKIEVYQTHYLDYKDDKFYSKQDSSKTSPKDFVGTLSDHGIEKFLGTKGGGLKEDPKVREPFIVKLRDSILVHELNGADAYEEAMKVKQKEAEAGSNAITVTYVTPGYELLRKAQGMASERLDEMIKKLGI